MGDDHHPFRRRVASAPEPEAPARYLPRYFDRPASNPIQDVQGKPVRFTSTPRGIILHGSHSGQKRSLWDEFLGNIAYATYTEFAFHRTIGDDAVGVHLPWDEKGWHARACSQTYLGFEFAQPAASNQNEDIPDGYVRAFCAEFMDARTVWPDLPLHFPTHAEVDGTAEYGGYNDGKWDVFSKGDPRADDLRARILARLASQYGVTS